MARRGGLESQPDYLGNLVKMSGEMPFLHSLIEEAHRAMIVSKGLPKPEGLTKGQTIENYFELMSSSDITAVERFLIWGVEGVLGLRQNNISKALLRSFTWAEWRIIWRFDRIPELHGVGLQVKIGSPNQEAGLSYFPLSNDRDHMGRITNGKVVILSELEKKEFPYIPASLRFIRVLQGGRLYFKGLWDTEPYSWLIRSDGTWSEDSRPSRKDKPAPEIMKVRPVILQQSKEMTEKMVFTSFLSGLFDPQKRAWDCMRY